MISFLFSNRPDPNFPDLSQHNNYLAKCLTPAIYNKLCKLKTQSGFTLDGCMQTGVDNPGHPFIMTVGLVAGDEECYELFSGRYLFRTLCYIVFVQLIKIKLKEKWTRNDFVLQNMNNSLSQRYIIFPHCSRPVGMEILASFRFQDGRATGRRTKLTHTLSLHWYARRFDPVGDGALSRIREVLTTPW